MDYLYWSLLIPLLSLIGYEVEMKHAEGNTGDGMEQYQNMEGMFWLYKNMEGMFWLRVLLLYVTYDVLTMSITQL